MPLPDNRIPLTELSPPLPGDGKFHVRLVNGFYQNLRRFISWPLILAFFSFIWLKSNELPLLLFDFSTRRIFIFGSTLSWHDLPILAGIMICGAAMLFFMAVGWGRIWCGFACPQSIWTWIFIRLEEWTEGRAVQRARDEQKPWTAVRMLRRVIKHISWLMVSFVTAFTFSAYFTPADELLNNLISLNSTAFTLSWLTVMTLLTYINAGLVREKVCLHMCPYSRFQGVMFDNHTRTVSYDATRGEPRNRIATANINNTHSGDCVDCNLCVQVCPTGIDIRQGLQAACIDCGACIDACDQVMIKLKRPTGLIGFYSENQLEKAPSNKSIILRWRLITYLSIVVVSSWTVTYAFNHRDNLIVEVQRDRNTLYEITGQQVCNHYQVKAEFLTDLEQPATVNLKSTGTALQLFGPKIMESYDNGVWQRYRVCGDSKEVSGRSHISFHISTGTLNAEKKSTFIAPMG